MISTDIEDFKIGSRVLFTKPIGIAIPAEVLTICNRVTMSMDLGVSLYFKEKDNCVNIKNVLLIRPYNCIPYDLLTEEEKFSYAVGGLDLLLCETL